MPTEHIKPTDAQHARLLEDLVSDELLVALYSLNRRSSQQPDSRALQKLLELDLVRLDDAHAHEGWRVELDPVARALLELVARTRKVPKPYKTDSRTCFGLAWYTNELDAEVVGFDGRQHRINGGFDHDRACGRDSSFDCYAGAARLFAVVLP